MESEFLGRSAVEPAGGDAGQRRPVGGGGPGLLQGAGTVAGLHPSALQPGRVLHQPGRAPRSLRAPGVDAAPAVAQALAPRHVGQHLVDAAHGPQPDGPARVPRRRRRQESDAPLGRVWRRRVTNPTLFPLLYCYCCQIQTIFIFSPFFRTFIQYRFLSFCSVAREFLHTFLLPLFSDQGQGQLAKINEMSRI